ncbi:MAG: CP12 domain-containing protein [Thainema sp.]
MSVDSTKFQAELDSAIAEAHRIQAEKGADSPECAAAWDAVEEMRAEVSHQHQASPTSNFQKYVDEHPDAPEARMYDD